MPAGDEDLRAALARKRALGQCPVCGISDWLFNRPFLVGMGDLVERPIGSGSPADDEDSMATFDDLDRGIVAVTCANCGFMRQHDTHVLFDRGARTDD
jgi:hypothetical protein